MSGSKSQPEPDDALSPEQLEAMSPEELLLAYRRSGNVELKWALALRYQGLIRRIALQICGIYSSFAQVEDIINEGVLTLLSSVDKFDPERGAKFETYVTKRIRGMIIDLARKQDWTPRGVRKRSWDIDQAVSELSGELGRFPTEREISDRLGVSPEKYRKDLADAALCNVMSLEALLEERQLGDGLRAQSDRQLQPEQALQDAELQAVLAQAISSLQSNEQTVLSLYYRKELNMKKIAVVMGVSEPRISQIHARAIRKLRLALESYHSETP